MQTWEKPAVVLRDETWKQGFFSCGPAPVFAKYPKKALEKKDDAAFKPQISDRN